MGVRSKDKVYSFFIRISFIHETTKAEKLPKVKNLLKLGTCRGHAISVEIIYS